MLFFLPALSGWLIFLSTALAGATQHPLTWILRATVLAACAFFVGENFRFSRGELVGLVVVAFLTISSALVSDDFGVALQTVLSVLSFFLVWTTSRRLLPATVYRWMHVVLVVAVAHSVWAIGQWAAGANRGQGGFFNPNELAACLAPLFIWMLSVIDKPVAWAWGEQILPLFWRYGIAVLLAVGLIVTGSRAALLATCVAVAFWAAAYSWRRVLLVVSLTGIILFGMALSSEAFRNRLTGNFDRFAFSRQQIWHAAVAVALQHPWGVGLGNVENALRVQGIPVDGWVRFPKQAHRPHSELLNIFVEFGYLGLSLVCAAVYLLAKHFWKTWRRREPDYYFAALCCSLFLPAVLSDALHSPPVALLAAFLLGAQLGSPNAPYRVPGGVLWRATAVAILLLALPSVVGVSAMQVAASERDQGNKKAARFWSRLGKQTQPWSLGAQLLDLSLQPTEASSDLDIGQQLVQLAEKFPRDPRPIERLIFLVRTGLNKEASFNWDVLEVFYHELHLRDPYNVFVWLGLAETYEHTERFEDATLALEKALAIEPHCATARAKIALGLPGPLSHMWAYSALESESHAAEYTDRARLVLTLEQPLRRALQDLLEAKL